MPERILIVDDDAANRALLVACLRAQYELLEASSGEQALGLLRDHPVDLVLLDVLMPGMDGHEVCRRIKADPSRGFLPVILLTGLVDQADRNAGLEAGADEFLTKPIDRRELLLRVGVFMRIRRQERQIAEQLRELTQLQSLKDELFALIVHDVRTPLTGVVGFVDLIRQGLQDKDDKLLRHATKAMEAARRVEELLGSVLEVQMLEAGELPLRLAQVRMATLVHDAAEALSGAAMAADVTVSVEAPDDIEARVDPHLVRRSVENLLANAIKYSPPREVVTVSVVRDADLIELKVSDRGPGVPNELKGVLFQKYGSVEAKSGRARRGHGLGLHLVKLVASAHGGTVMARDGERGGTTFVMRLAAAPG